MRELEPTHASIDANPLEEKTNMRLMFTAAAALALMTAPALAANATYGGANNATAATTPDASNPAIKTTEGNNPGAPAAGANSFTMGQAKARIESRGYAQVSELVKDKDGLWRGKAMKDGKSVNIALDYQGNVVTN
jgi:hypothetical protein